MYCTHIFIIVHAYWQTYGVTFEPMTLLLALSPYTIMSICWNVPVQEASPIKLCLNFLKASFSEKSRVTSVGLQLLLPELRFREV